MMDQMQKMLTRLLFSNWLNLLKAKKYDELEADLITAIAAVDEVDDG